MLRDDLKKEFDSLLPGRTGAAGPRRRLALQAAAGLGYAAATLPIAAQTAIHTNADGLAANMAHYEVNGFQVPAYVASPKGRGDLPVIVVVHEVFGLHEHIADICRRFAHRGYLAIAPDLFARQGDASKVADIGTLMSTIVSKVPDAQVLADLDGAMQWAGTHGGNIARAGITGFCWGGRIVWLYAAHSNVQAGVAWYGRLVGDSTPLTPQNPVDIAAQVRAPVLGLYGGKDPGISLDSIDKMKAALATGGPGARESQFMVYPEAAHAFYADYRASYVPSAAEDGWKRATAWFRDHGVI